MEFDKNLERFYRKVAEEFKPKHGIKKLFVGESIPSKGPYFYFPRKLGPASRERFSIFVFKKALRLAEVQANSATEYYYFLKEMQSKGAFLIDVYENPLEVKTKKTKEMVNRLIKGEEKIHGKTLLQRILELKPKEVWFILPPKSSKEDYYKESINQLRTELKRQGIKTYRENPFSQEGKKK